MRVVIDVGCAKYGGDESIPDLVDEFEPDLLYGYDPNTEERQYELKGTMVAEMKEAAWIHDGTTGFTVAGLGGRINPVGNTTPCIDLAKLINGFPEHAEIILKLDCEWSEYTLIPHLREQDADLRLKLALIEWHCEDCGIGGNGRHRDFCEGDHEAWDERRCSTEALLRCETGEWNR